MNSIRRLRAVLAFAALLFVLPVTTRAMLVAGGGPVDGGTMLCECWVVNGHQACICIWWS